MQRHSYSADLCDRLELVARGEAAGPLIDAGVPDEGAAVVTLPLFAWATPSRDVGRKGRNRRGGDDLLLPFRIEWNCPPVFTLAPGESVEVSWAVEGASDIPRSGTVVIEAVLPGDRDADPISQPLVNFPTRARYHVQTRQIVRRALNDTANGGRHAMWDILQTIEKNLEWGFQRALSSVKSEMGTDARLVDDVTAETLKSEILYGREGEGEPLALSLVRRCLDGEFFSRVDPLLYVRRWTYSTSESAIRRHLGDPHVGRRIRALARELGTDDEAAVLDEFVRRYPELHVGPQRVSDALSAPVRAWMMPIYEPQEVRQ